jgi:hypothetical protein
MKKKYFLCFALMLFAGSIFAQDTIAKPERNPNRFRMCILSKIYYMQPGSTGDNFLSAHKGSFGAGTELNLFTVYNFYFGIGYNFSQYKVTDASLAANAKHTNVNMFFGKVYYKIPVTDKFSVNPAIMVGQTNIKQRTGSKEYGDQEGWFTGLGADAEYEFTNWVALFFGARYNLIYTNTETAAQYRDYFRKLNQFNVSAGIRFGINK